MDEILIEPLKKRHFKEIINFTDKYIGPGYYTTKNLDNVLLRSQKNDITFSWVLLINNKLQGIRFTFPPGNWKSGKGTELTTDKWPHSIDDTAYFQTITLANEICGKGLGKTLSKKSIKQLIEQNVKGIAAHSWVESPNNSSRRYLDSLGFQVIAHCPNYWKDIDYLCAVCLQKPCVCNAVEMYLDLSPQKGQN